MKLIVEKAAALPAKCDLLCVLGAEQEGPAAPRGVRVPPLALQAFTGEFREVRLTDALSGPAQRFLQIGLGKRKELTAERLRRAGALAAKRAEAAKAKSLVLLVERGTCTGVAPAAAGQALAEGLVLGSYALRRFKSKPKPVHLAEARLCGPDVAFAQGARKGATIARSNLFVRELQDTPANLMRPRDLAAAARGLAKPGLRTRCTLLERRALERLGMGSFLSVARGSQEPPYLIHLVYRPAGRARAKLALVGKGLTFDTGGISIKPSAKMDEMKYDMSGGAAVLGVVRAVAELGLPVELHGIVAATENMPDGRATKPGDLVTAMNGLTIEVLNTDAEGRLVLADALVYTETKVKPDAIVDLATLTGAVITALGHELTGVMASDETLAAELVAAGKASGELVWHLPLLEQHKEHMKGAVGDLKNINAGQGAGSSAGAAFLAHFVQKVPWAHLDIAGSAWGAEERDYQGGNLGTGVGVRLLVEWIERRVAR